MPVRARLIDELAGLLVGALAGEDDAAPSVQGSIPVPGPPNIIDALLRSQNAADQDLARARIRAALDDSAGDVHAAAKILGVSARTAYRYVARAGLAEHAAHLRAAAGASDPRTKGQVSPKPSA